MTEAEVQEFITENLDAISDATDFLRGELMEYYKFVVKTPETDAEREITESKLETILKHEAQWQEAASLPDERRTARALIVFDQCVKMMSVELGDILVFNPILYADMERLNPSAADRRYAYEDRTGNDVYLYYDVIEYDFADVLDVDQVILSASYSETNVYIAGGVPAHAAALYHQMRVAGSSIVVSETAILEAIAEGVNLEEVVNAEGPQAVASLEPAADQVRAPMRLQTGKQAVAGQNKGAL